MTSIQQIWEVPEQRSSQGWHLSPQKNLLDMVIIIVDLLKCKNGHTHMAQV